MDALEGLYVIFSDGNGKDQMIAYEIQRIIDAMEDIEE